MKSWENQWNLSHIRDRRLGECCLSDSHSKLRIYANGHAIRFEFQSKFMHPARTARADNHLSVARHRWATWTRVQPWKMIRLCNISPISTNLMTRCACASISAIWNAINRPIEWPLCNGMLDSIHPLDSMHSKWTQTVYIIYRYLAKVMNIDRYPRLRVNADDDGNKTPLKSSSN